ncbi:DUF397 domain-containing protein [Streptomyces fuscichromogenes]|uniref:DUF397 domain-containing protein n=1 Tax=Streptomyces fuscichromogenes TaxID=1324013 RepID=A0A917XJ66_9ACTN|nr:DUF397 domain-containing protein [Streptomyces fuscichromogenes]GGN28851.1 hypothetical protein GCM10011578_065120 [Streptomyces fuscichromogenes]
MNSQQLAWFKSSYSDGEGGDCVEAAYTWRKSSYSGGEGGECLEVGYPWRKSSHSDGEGGECLEVRAAPSVIHIRDSKCADASRLTLSPSSWSAFLREVADPGAAPPR